MEAGQIEKVESLLYDEYTEDEIQAIVSQIDDQEVLYVYTYNYNWDDGFKIPQLVLDHDQCDLSIALLVFIGLMGSVICSINPITKDYHSGLLLLKHCMIPF